MSAHRLKMRPVATLTHFTRAGKTSSALDNLVTILREGVIRGSSRMVREGRAVVCLFDVPIHDLRLLLDPRNRRRYEPFGIAIEKRSPQRESWWASLANQGLCRYSLMLEFLTLPHSFRD